MSDEEEERVSEEEEEHEVEEAPKESGEKTEAELAMIAAKKKHDEEEAAKLQEYEAQRKLDREKEEEELRQLKEKQERRRKEREEEEAQLAERKKAEEERRKEEEEQRKAKIEADKQKKEAEKAKRQQMMAGQFGTGGTPGQPNFSVPAKTDKSQEKFDKFGNIVKAKAEMGLTKDQQEEMKKKFLHDHLQPLSLEGMDAAAIKAKVKELHSRICKLEADKYDLEKRHERQEYDLKELNERQRQINRNKALKKGLDPDAANSRFPPKVSVASKYDRQTDRRTYTERRNIYENNKKSFPLFPNIPPPIEELEHKISEGGIGDDEAGEEEDEYEEEEEEEEE